MATLKLPREIEGIFTVPIGKTVLVEDVVNIFPGPSSNQCGSLVNMGGILSIPEAAGLIVFNEIDESLYVGGHKDGSPRFNPETDPGIWTLEDGVNDIRSKDQRPRYARGYDTSWTTLDSLMTYVTATDEWEEVVKGDSLPIEKDGLPAYVVKLTDDIKVNSVRADGELGRPHLFMGRVNNPQRIEGGFLNVGPAVFSRYGIHFHMGNTVGSEVHVLITNFGGNGLVTHASDGVNHTNTAVVAIDPRSRPATRKPDGSTIEHTGVTWDAGDENASHDNNYDHVTVAGTRGSHQHSGFSLRVGDRNRMHFCGAVGIKGPDDTRANTAQGSGWPGGDGSGLWDYRFNWDLGCSAGVGFWTNEGHLHTVIDHLTISPDGSGINNGAYSNRVQYIRHHVIGAKWGMVNHAASKGGVLASLGGRPDGYGLAFEDNLFEDCETGIYLMSAPPRSEGGPILLLNNRIMRSTIKPIVMAELNVGEGPKTRAAAVYHFVGNETENGNLTPANFDLARMNPRSRIMVENEDDTPAWEMDSAGIVTPINPFYTLNPPAEGNFMEPEIVQSAAVQDTATATLPDPTTAGNKLIALHHADNMNGLTVPAPDGWTKLPDFAEDEGTVSAFEKIADGSMASITLDVPPGKDTSLYLIESPVGDFNVAGSNSVRAAELGFQTEESLATDKSLVIAFVGIGRFDNENKFTIDDYKIEKQFARKAEGSAWAWAVQNGGGIAQGLFKWNGNIRARGLILAFNAKEVPLPAPVKARFDVEPMAGDAPLMVTVDDTSRGPVSTILAEWGDGHATDVVLGGQVVHTYAEPSPPDDPYEIIYTVTGDDGQFDIAPGVFITVTEPEVVEPPSTTPAPLTLIPGDDGFIRWK